MTDEAVAGPSRAGVRWRPVPLLCLLLALVLTASPALGENRGAEARTDSVSPRARAADARPAVDITIRARPGAPYAPSFAVRDQAGSAAPAASDERGLRTARTIAERSGGVRQKSGAARARRAKRADDRRADRAASKAKRSNANAKGPGAKGWRALDLRPKGKARADQVKAGAPAGTGVEASYEASPVQMPPGPARVVVGLGALFVTQFDGSRYANGNCNMAAGAMLFEVQTGRTTTGAQLRRWSGARTRGTDLRDLRRAFARQGQPLLALVDVPWDRFMREVRRGRSAVVQGWYGQLPAQHVLQPGFTTGHSVFVLGYSRHVLGGRGGFYVMDPLGRGDYDGAWWSAATLRAFGWSGTPGRVGSDRASWYGNVAFQANPTAKDLFAKANRPVFQSYWDTAKSLLAHARRIQVVSSARRTMTLRVDDPRLRLTAARARWRGIASPLAPVARVKRGFRDRDPFILLRTWPGARVNAVAKGRVVYRGWSRRTGLTLWVKHGPRLYTIYQGLSRTRPEPGQWVWAGQKLGNLVSARGAHRSTLRFAVSTADPRFKGARVDPARFLDIARGRLR